MEHGQSVSPHLKDVARLTVVLQCVITLKANELILQNIL